MKTQIEKAIDELKEAMKGDSKEAIEAKTESLSTASNKLAERLYAKKGQADQAQAQEEQQQPAEEQPPKGNEEAIDAEFEEVKEDEDKDKK